MTKSILISLAVLTVSTSGALAAYRTHHHYHPAMNANAGMGAAPAPAPVMWTGGVSGADRELYFRSLRESGYNPKENFNANGTLKTQ